MKKRGQISIEYLIIMGFVMFLVISVLGFSLAYSAQIKDRIKFYQLEQYSEKVIASAESVYYAGEPSLATISAYFPVGVTSFNITDNHLLYTVSTASGETMISYSSNVPISGTFRTTEGVHRIRIEAGTEVVTISNTND